MSFEFQLSVRGAAFASEPTSLGFNFKDQVRDVSFPSPLIGSSAKFLDMFR